MKVEVPVTGTQKAHSSKNTFSYNFEFTFVVNRIFKFIDPKPDAILILMQMYTFHGSSMWEFLNFVASIFFFFGYQFVILFWYRSVGYLLVRTC